MCYAFPGPRCSRHASRRLAKAQEMLAKNPADVTLVAQVEEAREQYLQTPVAIKAMLASDDPRIQALGGHYRAQRAEKIAAYKAMKAGDVTQKVEDYLLRTAHGSRLYGLDHTDSDQDWYLVVPEGKKRASQKIVGDQDVMVLTLGEFSRQVHKGVPQALEALFSPMGDKLPLDAYRQRFYPDTAKTAEVYRRTIKNFMFMGGKHRRHALRLCANLTELLHTGRFNPQLSVQQREEFTSLANSSPEEYFDAVLQRCPVVIFSTPEDEASAREEVRASWDLLDFARA